MQTDNSYLKTPPIKVHVYFLPAPLNLLREHKFKQYYQDTVNPLYPHSLETELTSHFFLRCQNFTNLCKYLVKQPIKIDLCILTLYEKSPMKLPRR